MLAGFMNATPYKCVHIRVRIDEKPETRNDIKNEETETISEKRNKNEKREVRNATKNETRNENLETEARN